MSEKVESLIQQIDGESREKIYEWYSGGRTLRGVEARDFVTAMKEGGLVVRLTKPNGRVKEVTVHSGDLTQVNKSPGEEPAKGYGMRLPEFKDYLFSGRYAIELIPHSDSYFREAPDIQAKRMGGDEV